MRVPEENSREATSDEGLMVRVAGGDLDAFGLLVDRHHQRALNFAYRLYGDAEQSKDIVQESFLRILKAARRYEPRAAFTTYLFHVVRNMVRETARRSGRRKEEPLESFGTEPSPDSALPGAPQVPADPEAEQERAEIRERLLIAMRRLPEDLRTVFVLSEMEGMSYRQIAEICHCPEGTVASRKHAAVRKLRLLLKPMGDLS